jgi:hypothetical protein
MHQEPAFATNAKELEKDVRRVPIIFSFYAALAVSYFLPSKLYTKILAL